MKERENEYIMSYLGLVVAIVGFWVIVRGNWCKSFWDSAAIILMFITIAYFILCSISIGLRKKLRTGWMQWLSKKAVQLPFGHLSLFVGLVSLGISFMYSHLMSLGLLAILIGYGVLAWGISTKPKINLT